MKSQNYNQWHQYVNEMGCAKGLYVLYFKVIIENYISEIVWKTVEHTAP